MRSENPTRPCYPAAMRWVAALAMALFACTPKADGSGVVSGDGTTAPASGEDGASGAGATSGSSGASGVSTTTSSSTGQLTADDVKMDVFEPEPVVGECVRAGDLQGSVAVDTPIGAFAVASAFWGWNWCCGPYPVVVLSEEDVLRVEDRWLLSLPSDQPGFMAMIGPSGAPPWTGDSASRFVAGRGSEYDVTGWERTTTIVSVLEEPEPEPETDPVPLEVAFAEDGAGWRVEGSIIAEYCPALEYPPCPCE